MVNARAIISQTTTKLLGSWRQMCSISWRFWTSLNPWFSISQRLLAMRKISRLPTRRLEKLVSQNAQRLSDLALSLRRVTEQRPCGGARSAAGQAP